MRDTYLISLLIFSFHLYGQQTHKLFYIEKSQSENIVIYDVKTDENGKFLAKNAMDPYWWNTKEKYRYEFNWIEQYLAYGCDYKVNLQNNTIAMKMKALKGRWIHVFIKDGKPHIQMAISGKQAYVEKVYIKVAKQFYPPLEYIEIIGNDITTGTKIVERVFPKKIL